MTRLSALFASIFGLLLSAATVRAEVTVFAAASLQGALSEIAEGYDTSVRLSFSGSGTIARQVAAGAPVDVIVLAHPVWMDWLADRGHLGGGDPVAVASNALVLVGTDGAAPLTDLSQVAPRLTDARLAMGQRDAVPAGIYARQWFQFAGVWDQISPRLAETDNVRAALALVARGETPLGVVYATDAAAAPEVDVLLTAPAEAHDPIVYPAAALTEAGTLFLTHLQSQPAQTIFAKHGFQEPPA